MLSKKKLQKIEAILESYLPLFESQASGKHSSSTVPLSYATGLNLLVKTGSFKEMVNPQNRIKNAKIVRAAKNLVIQFEDFGLSSYTELTDKMMNSIKTINGKSKLAPSEESVKATVSDKFADYELECDAFYNSLLIDIFGQGRMHQTVANPNSQVSIKKFALYDQRESESFDSIAAHLKDELFVYLDYLRLETEKNIKRCYAKGYSKPEIIIFLNKKFSKHSCDMQEIFRKHCWQVYSFGNIYQLKKDSVQHVAWKTGHHIDDCLTCRAFQNGDSILKDAESKELFHIKLTDAIIYNIDDILKIAKLDGPSFFCHNDCRCQFISADNKKTAF